MALPSEEVTAKLATGEATRVGDLPGAPVLFGDRYWLADGARYVLVDDGDLDRQLRRDHQRLKAADAAVEQAPPGGTTPPEEPRPGSR